MNLKLILGLALVLSCGLLGCSAIADNPANSNQWRGFEILPPITNANPSIRLPLLVHVPTKLKIEGTTDTLSVEIDKSSLEATNLMVGTNMVTGVENGIYVYPDGEPRPAIGGYGLGGTDFNLGTSFWHTKQDGIPLPGKKYVVEVELTVFETDIPPQHMWSPHGKNYKAIWQRTLKQTVQTPVTTNADASNDPLKLLLSKSDLVVLGTITNEPIEIELESGVPNYICEFQVEDVLKGDTTLKGRVIAVNIMRFEMEAKDKHPLIKKGSECILFLKADKPHIPSWVTADFWFGVQYPSPWMARDLKQLALEQ